MRPTSMMRAALLMTSSSTSTAPAASSIGTSLIQAISSTEVAETGLLSVKGQRFATYSKICQQNERQQS